MPTPARWGRTTRPRYACGCHMKPGWSRSRSPRSAPCPTHASGRSSRLDQTVRVEDELLGRALVEVLVPLLGLVQADHGRVDRLGDLRLVVEDHLHQAVVVLHHRTLSGGEAV